MSNIIQQVKEFLIDTDRDVIEVMVEFDLSASEALSLIITNNLEECVSCGHWKESKNMEMIEEQHFCISCFNMTVNSFI